MKSHRASVIAMGLHHGMRSQHREQQGRPPTAQGNKTSFQSNVQHVQNSLETVVCLENYWVDLSDVIMPAHRLPQKKLQATWDHLTMFTLQTSAKTSTLIRSHRWHNHSDLFLLHLPSYKEHIDCPFEGPVAHPDVRQHQILASV